MSELGSGKLAAIRFWSKTKRSKTGCLLWTAGTDKDGYGKFQLNIAGQRKQVHVRAHRYAFFLRHGRWPTRLLRHTCDTPACVEERHLVDGTQSDNRNDCVVRGREPRGEGKVNAVLTEEIVTAAKALPKKRGELARFARARGVNYFTLYQAAVGGLTWRHV